MHTEYICFKCQKVFVEEGLPNINKRHTCGAVARVQSVKEKKDAGDQ